MSDQGDDFIKLCEEDSMASSIVLLDKGDEEEAKSLALNSSVQSLDKIKNKGGRDFSFKGSPLSSRQGSTLHLKDRI